MPISTTDMLIPRTTIFAVALEPAHSALSSLVLLYKTEHMPGVHDWVTHTAAKLSPQLQETQAVVLDGLHAAIQPQRSYNSFLSYLEDIAAQPATKLRDQVIYSSCLDGERLLPNHDIVAVMSSPEAYLAQLRRSFPNTELNIAAETSAYWLLQEPQRMQDVIVSHLQTMWNEFMAPEWERVEPMLGEAVAAGQQIDLSHSSVQAAARTITGQDLAGSKWEHLLADAKRVIFVPSAHIGPYLSKFSVGQSLWVIYGARLPEGATLPMPAVSRSDLLVRLGALNDDTRLRILELIGQQGELGAPEITQRLGLSQSAASRHLQQLSATGYLSERRREGAKWYSLNRSRIDETFHALTRYVAAH